KTEGKINNADIRGLVKDVLDAFYAEKGEEMELESKLIERAFVAARKEVEKIIKKDISDPRTRAAAVENAVDWMPTEQYIHAPVEVRRVAGGGCGRESLDGEFGGRQSATG